jgi:hypothetical protein
MPARALAPVGPPQGGAPSPPVALGDGIRAAGTSASRGTWARIGAGPGREGGKIDGSPPDEDVGLGDP